MRKDSSVINPECALRLKAILKEQKKTQASLAEDTGYSVPYISYILNGKQPLSIKSAKKIAGALGVRQEYLLCEDDCKTLKELELFDKRKLLDKLQNMEIEERINLTALLIIKNIETNNENHYISNEDREEFRKDIADYIEMRTEKWLIPRLKENDSEE